VGCLTSLRTLTVLHKLSESVNFICYFENTSDFHLQLFLRKQTVGQQKKQMESGMGSSTL
jgi:hypothetical protein